MSHIHVVLIIGSFERLMDIYTPNNDFRILGFVEFKSRHG